MYDQSLRMADVMQQSKHRYNLKHRFEIVKSLGAGTYGKVKLAIDKKTGDKVAIKSIAKKKISCEQDLTRIRREIEIMASLNHKHIVQIFEVFENKQKIILVMEYADGGELYDHISSRGRLSEKEARSIFRQIVSAVHHLHENGIVHRDLKLENILLDKNGQVKLADFGLSNTWHHNRFLNTYCGSPLYASPEIVNGRPYYGPEVDCWSLGVLLYTLVYGAMPFDGSDFNRLKKQISTGDYYEPSKQSGATPLIRRLLTVNPAKRANVMDTAAHWWTNKDCNNLHDDLDERNKRTSDYFEEHDLSDGCIAESTPERIITPAFDSNRKPKKSILKNRKMSSSDSGCGLSDTPELSLVSLRISNTNDNTLELNANLTQSKAAEFRKEQNDRRCSVSSNSSADILDFSCDSSEAAESPDFSAICAVTSSPVRPIAQVC